MKHSIHAVIARWRYGAVLAVVAAGLPAAAQPPDPADPNAAVPALETPSVLPAGAGDYMKRIDGPRLPWTRLYEADGSFVPESAFDGATAAVPAPGAEKSAMAPSPQGGDSRGVVRRIDMAQGKVSIKHGPIQKLDMPGMTMTFRAKDPALLDGLKPGDEVDFDVVIEGTTFFITKIRK